MGCSSTVLTASTERLPARGAINTAVHTGQTPGGGRERRGGGETVTQRQAEGRRGKQEGTDESWGSS